MGINAPIPYAKIWTLNLLDIEYPDIRIRHNDIIIGSICIICLTVGNTVYGVLNSNMIQNINKYSNVPLIVAVFI